MTKFHDQIIAWYKFDDAGNVGKDSSGQGNDGVASGAVAPTISNASGRAALTLGEVLMIHRIYSLVRVMIVEPFPA